MSDLYLSFKTFSNKEFGNIRVVEKDNEPWFVGKDIATVLGYSNVNDAIKKHIDKEDKGVAKCDTLGGKQNLTIINESGLYSLILSSKLPGAKKFKKWVTSEVLPSIRKTGGYIPTNESMTDAEIMAKALLVAQKTIENKDKHIQEIKSELNIKNQVIGELKPKADYTDIILQNKGLVTITQIAKDYGMSGQELNSLLHGLKVQYKQSDQWLLYSKYQAKGYTHSETIPITRSNGIPDIKMITKWTQKGRLFLYNILKTNSILPVIEKNEEI